MADVLPSNIRKNSGLSVGWQHEGLKTSPPYIADITEECSKGLARTVRALRFEKQFFDIRVLTMNLRAPDALLKKQFETLLKEQRKRSRLPAKRRGRPSTNFEVTNDHLRSWRQYNVLAVFDLDFCAQVFGIDPLTHGQLGNLLECDRDIDPKEWGRAARDKAAEAMQCLDVLAAQIQAKTSVGEGGPK